MVAVFFVYGLAFFLLGFAILVYPKRQSAFAPSRVIWLLGVFGLLHGANEWLDMHAVLQGSAEPRWSSLLRMLVLPASFAPLAAFGLSRDGRVAPAGWTVAGILLLAWAAIVAVSSAPETTGPLWARYLLGTTGTA